MKQSKFGRRIVSLLLVLIMVVTLLPLSTIATAAVNKNDIVVSANKGTTGIDTDTLNNNGDINWPIKLYDNLADGMLFEFAQYGGDVLYSSSQTYTTGGGQYVLGQPMPYTTVRGYDFTTDADYAKKVNSAYSTSESYSHKKTRPAAVNYSSPRYMRISMQSSYNTSYKNCMITNFYDDFGSYATASSNRYMMLVYRAEGLSATSSDTNYIGFNSSRNGSSWGRFNDSGIIDVDGNYVRNTGGQWKCVVIDLKANCSTNNWTSHTNYGMDEIYIRLGLNSTSDYFDLAYIYYFPDSASAKAFGNQCLQFIADPGEYISGTTWNSANNTAFGMLYSSNGASWPSGGGNPNSTLGGTHGGYYTYQIGYRPSADVNADTYNNNRKDGKDANGRFNGTGDLIGDNGIHFIQSAYDATDGVYSMRDLDFGGYHLLTDATKGLWTAGLLECTLGADGTPVYKQDTVEYIADLLSKTLTIPRYGTNGNPNYNYVAGVKNAAQYGTTSGTANDLAQALRNCLGITFTSGQSRGSVPTMGTYAETIAKADKLKGAFLPIANAGHIKTCMDAAYYLLNNSFVANSYNQEVNDYQYLTLSSATLDNGTEAFVFDGGFSYGASLQDLIDGKITQAQYKAAAKNSVNYSARSKGGDASISLIDVDEKDLVYYAGAEYARTTRFPFLPVVGSTGVYAGETKSYYFAEDEKRSYEINNGTYNERNYNYTMVSNGEFVYNEEDELYFEFEGDDDVYLFINNQLVLDIGGGHSISNCSLEVNEYVNWAKEVVANPSDYSALELQRAQALDLEDGEIASFDFFYMERHGYGANCRIVTNMHITDPDVRVDKRAYQGGKEIEYGGIVDAEDPVEYTFSLTNSGNQKLYNLTFDDNNIGVSLTPDNGLVVRDDSDIDLRNGYFVTDVHGEELDAKDLTAVVTGWQKVDSGGDYIVNDHIYTQVAPGTGTHIYYDEIVVNFADNEALKNFLRTLQSANTDTDTVDEELTQKGAGLWVDATVTFKGIYYTLEDKYEEAGMFDNTVYVTGTTRVDINDEACITKKSEDRHRVYTTAIPKYYQWSGHDIFVSKQRVYDDAAAEAGKTGSMLHDYIAFFNTVNGDISKFGTALCDRTGKKVANDYYEHVTLGYQAADGPYGYKTNYDEPGIYEFYLLMYLYSSTGDIETMSLGQYAIVRVLIIVTDTNDAKYVLDYGLSTENLDANGELFKGDELLGTLSGTQAKVMGFANTQPSYHNVTDRTSEYNRINFNALDLSDNNRIETEDGFYKANIAIPDDGRIIKYDGFTGKYTLSDTGTVTVHANVPVAWEDMYLYYWYDDGRNNGWPGEKMSMASHGNYQFEIPDNVPHIIISNGTNQTANLDITPGLETWVDIPGTITGEGDSARLESTVSHKTADGVLHISVPEGWGDVYVYCWDNFNNGLTDMPGIKIEEVDEDGFYTYVVPADITHVLVNNGVIIDEEKGSLEKQTVDQIIYAGEETWLTVNETYDSQGENGTYYYKATASKSTEAVTMHATVPDDWATAKLYYWNSNGSSTGVEWPGLEMTKAEDGTYYIENIPSDVTNVIVNDGGSKQTYDYLITPGLETWITVKDIDAEESVFATVPNGWGDVYFYFFNDSGTVGTEWPGTKGINAYGSTYFATVPFGATKYIVNNDNGYQTQDLLLIPGKTTYVNAAHYNALPASATTLTITAPDTWQTLNIYAWNSGTNVNNAEWPGVQAEKNDEGKYVFTLSKDFNKFIINNGTTQTQDVSLFFMGDENLITVYEDGGYTIGSPNTIETKFSATVAYGEDAEEEGFTFTPTKFMDSFYDIWMAITVHDTDINTSSKPTPLGQTINVGKEVQMYKKITVLPANVVYYEDDFAGIKYNYASGNVVTHYSEGSGGLKQNVDQSQQYGQDEVYQGSENDEITGGSMTDVYINNKDDFASFEFTGTGVEIIGHTHAVGSGTLVVTIYDENGNKVKKVPVITEFDNGADGGTESIGSVPLVRIDGLTFGTYTVKLSGVPVYDFSNWTDKTQDPPTKTSYLCIDGIRVYQPLQENKPDSEYGLISEDAKYTLDYGTSKYVTELTDGHYTSGSTWNVGSWVGFNKTQNVDTSGQGVVTLDLGKVYNIDEIRANVCSTFANDGIGNPLYIEVYYAINAKDQYKFAGNLDVTAGANEIYWADLIFAEGLTNIDARYLRIKFGPGFNDHTWVMVDEIEVYGYEKGGIVNGSNDAYIETENGATFEELRDLISDRKAFAIKYDDTDGLSVSGGTSTWIENRNETLPSNVYAKWTNNIVNSVNDYLLAGPNNEVYVMESTEADKSALVFYVAETKSDVRNLQIAMKAMDYGAYVGSAQTGQLNAEIQYGVQNEDGTYAWKPLTTLVSTSEQYFTIPYEECPYDEANDRYQVIIRVADTTTTGMASFTSVKYKGLELLELNTTEVPDVIYNDELSNTLVDNNGNTLSTSDFLGFLQIADQMQSNAVVMFASSGSDSEETIVGTDTSAMGALYDTFTAYNDRNFALTENSRLYLVTDTEDTPPANDVIETAQLVQRQFAAKGYELEIVWGLEQFVEKGDIAVFVDAEKYFVGMEGTDEAYQIHVGDKAASVLTKNSDAMLYGLNTLLKHFIYADNNAIKGFMIEDAPDTAERTVHLDMARKYLTKEFIQNYIAEMSWMGYNAIELHLAEDGGFRSNIWDGTTDFESPTGNDFSWAIGSMLQPWCYDCPDPDIGKYLTGAELVEICETAKEYHMEVIPSFDTPAHVGWMTKKYETEYNSGNTSVSQFNYGGQTLTLPARINYRTTGTYDYAVLNLGNDNVQKLAFAMYTDIAAFFHEYAGSTHFNIGADEVGLESTDTWNYADFIDYVNDLNDVIKGQGYESIRMYNDFADRPKYQSITDRTLPELDADIEIVFWDGPNTNGASWDTTTDIKKADDWVAEGRNIYSGVQFWTYYTSRIANPPNTNGKYDNNANYLKDSRDPTNTWWTFYRNQEDYAYDEWNPTRFSEYTDTTYSYYYGGEQLKGGYFMVWCDYAGVNTEVEHWQGVWDSTATSSNGKYFYSLIYRMWSNAAKQWNWDINNTLTFANFKNLRDTMLYFPGYDDANTTTTSSYMSALALPAAVEMSEEPYRSSYTVTFKNWDGTQLKTETVVHGNAATAPVSPEREADVWYTYTFSGWDTDFSNITGDTVVTATYTSEATVAGKIGYLEVKVSGGTGFTMSVNDGTARPQGTEYVNASMKFGQKVTLTAETTNDNRFVGWASAKTGDILSTERTYTFYTSGNDVLIALFRTDIANQGIVTFKNDKNNQIIDIQYYSSTDAIAFPDDISYPGYEFVGWRYTQVEIQSLLAEGKDVTVYPIWNVADKYFTITVNGGGVATSSGTNAQGQYLGYKGVTVGPDKAPSGKAFSHWVDADGKVLSYEENYTFYPYEDTELTAIYVSNIQESIIISGTKPLPEVEDTEPDAPEETPEETPTAEPFTVYLYNTLNWANPYVCIWNADAYADYPTIEMTLVEGNLYSAEIPSDIGFMFFGGTNASGVPEETDLISEFVDERAYIPAWNNGAIVIYNDDSKVETEEMGTIEVYFLNNWQWSDVCIYYWGVDGAAEWPGESMYVDSVNGDNTLYKFDLPAGAEGMIINGIKNDGSGYRDQTPDITEFVDGRIYRMAWNSEQNKNDVLTDDGYVADADANTCKVYVRIPNDWIANDSEGGKPWFAAYVWDANNNSFWYKLEHVSGNIYEADPSTAYNGIIITRMKSSSDAFGWSNVLNQSSNMTYSLEDPMNMIQLNEGSVASGENVHGTGANMNTVFFTNNKNWKNITVSYADIYGVHTVQASFVEKNADGYDVYSMLIPSNASKVIISNGSKTVTYVSSAAIPDRTIFSIGTTEVEIEKGVAITTDIDTEGFGDANTVYLNWNVSEATNYEFLNVGLLLVKEEDYNESIFAMGTIDPRVIQFTPAKKYQTATGVHSVTIPGVAEGETWMARAYIQYKDESGKLQVMYSDTVTATK